MSNAPDEPISSSAAAAELIQALGICLRTCAMYDLTNSLVNVPIMKLVAAVNGASRDGGTVAIQLVNEKFFMNKRFVRLDSTVYQQSKPLMQIFRRLRINEIAFQGERLEPRPLLAFLEAFKRHLPTSTPEALMEETFEAVAVRTIDGTEADAFDETTTPEKTVIRQYCLLVIFLGRVSRALHEGKPVRLAGLRRMLQKLADASEGFEPLLLTLGGLPQVARSPHSHGVRCATMTMLMGKKLGLGRGALIDIALAALFHDVAREDLQPDSVQRTMSPAESVRRTSLRSIVQMCRSGVGLDTHMRLAVAREVWSPLNAAPAPSLPARMVAIPCAFDLLTRTTTTRRGLLPERAIRFIARQAGRRYDARMLRLFASSVGVYPAGTTLDLTDGSVVLVRSGATPNSQPRVQLLRRGTVQTNAPVAIATSVDPLERGVNVAHYFFG